MKSRELCSRARVLPAQDQFPIHESLDQVALTLQFQLSSFRILEARRQRLGSYGGSEPQEPDLIIDLQGISAAVDGTHISLVFAIAWVGGQKQAEIATPVGYPLAVDQESQVAAQ